MTYMPRWERLSETLTRVIGATGLTEIEAKAVICQALSDGAVAVRSAPRKHATKGTTSRDTILNGSQIQIPFGLEPEHLDWERSRPLKEWLVPRGTFPVPGYWHLEWIELSVTDVTKELCISQAAVDVAQQTLSQTSETSRSRPAAASRSRSRPTFDRAQRAVGALYPGGVPAPVDLPNKSLCQRVGEWLVRESPPFQTSQTKRS